MGNFFALNDQGGQSPVSLQLVNTPLFTIVLSFVALADTPLSLGSFSALLKTVL